MSDVVAAAPAAAAASSKLYKRLMPYPFNHVLAAQRRAHDMSTGAILKTKQ